MVLDPQRENRLPGGPMSEEEYLALNRNAPFRKYEYVDGVARLMSGGSGEHDQISRNIAFAIEQNLLTGPCFVRGSDMQVVIGVKPDGSNQYVYPDTTVSCDVYDRRRGSKQILSPRIVVEVLSPSTERDDRGPKLKAYKACPDIQEILLVNQFAEHVEVYRRAEEDSTTWNYSQYGPGEDFSLESIDVPLTMAEIYRRVNFDEPLVGDE